MADAPPALARAAMSVYEVHLGSWRVGLGYRELAKELVEYVKWLGFTHVEFMPVAEHPFGGSWGYQVTSYFAPTSRFGHPDEFRHLVDDSTKPASASSSTGCRRTSRRTNGPWPGSTAKRCTSTPTRASASTRTGAPVFDFGRREVRNFLVANALYWLDEFHIDGLRVDAVASMLYLDYSREDVGAEHLRRPRKPGSGLVPPGGQRHGLQPDSRRGDDRRGVHRIAGRHPADPRRRPGLRPQMEHGLDARLAQYMAKEPSTAATTTAS